MLLEDVFAQTAKFVAEPIKNCYYFIAAHTINGARFYSEPYSSAINAVDNYNDYIDLVKYFGGGTVELFKIDEQDFDVISVSRV